MTRLRQGFSGRRINPPFYLFWPVFFLLSLVICQRVTCKLLNINRLKNEKNEFSCYNREQMVEDSEWRFVFIHRTTLPSSRDRQAYGHPSPELVGTGSTVEGNIADASVESPSRGSRDTCPLLKGESHLSAFVF